MCCERRRREKPPTYLCCRFLLTSWEEPSPANLHMPHTCDPLPPSGSSPCLPACLSRTVLLLHHPSPPLCLPSPVDILHPTIQFHCLPAFICQCVIVCLLYAPLCLKQTGTRMMVMMISGSGWEFGMDGQDGQVVVGGGWWADWQTPSLCPHLPTPPSPTFSALLSIYGRQLAKRHLQAGTGVSCPHPTQPPNPSPGSAALLPSLSAIYLFGWRRKFWRGEGGEQKKRKKAAFHPSHASVKMGQGKEEKSPSLPTISHGLMSCLHAWG